MAVARTHHTKDYTCMSNYHFKDKSISLKAKGLLSMMLSLPDEWDYSVAGLAALSSDGETSVRTAVKELEEHRYLKRTPIRENGRIVDWEYDIYEKPEEILDVENQQVESLLLENNDNKILKQSNTKKVNNTNSKELVQNFDFGGKQKPKKENLYTKCVSLINDYTTDEKLRKALIDYLRVRLEMKDKPLYTNSWKGLLNKLDRDFDASERLQVVYQSIERGYASFFPVNSYSNNLKDKPWERGVKSDGYTEEEKRQLEKEQQEMEARGEQVWY
jgi:hypothetical protein